MITIDWFYWNHNYQHYADAYWIVNKQTPISVTNQRKSQIEAQSAMDIETTFDERNWRDITASFLDSVKHLNLGELLKLDQFTLLEAMSAIELMDPKIDSGAMLKKRNRKVLTFEQSVKNGVIKINNLQINELIGIIDESYACLTTWFEGYSLAQTVMTNLYFHQPERVEDRCLRIFSLAFLKTVDFIDKLVQLVYCVEEEDFHMNVSRFPLANHINEQKVLNSIEDLCLSYEKLYAHPQTFPVQNTDSRADEFQLSTHYDQKKIDKTELSGLISRLRFTYHFYACFFNINRSLLKNLWNPDPLNEAQVLRTTKLVQNCTTNCDSHLEKCNKHLKGWRDTIDLGIKPAHQSFNDGQDDGDDDYPIMMGFDPHINHKLLPPAYPRCPSIKSRPSTVDYLDNLIIRLKECISISNSFNQKSFTKSQDSIEYLSKYFKPSSCVVSRSFIQTLYLPNRSIKLMKDELMQSLTEYCEPQIQAMRRDEVKSNALDGFLTECASPFSQAINIYGHNTARQHEKYPELIVSFKNLQYSALLINNTFNNIIVYSWTTFNLARICIKYIISGLELELFSPHEYPYVFWYLYDILYRNEKEQLEIARQFIYDSQLLSDDNQKKNKAKKQRKKNQQSTSYHDKSLLSNEAFRFLTGGLFLLTYGLKLQGKIKQPLVELVSDDVKKGDSTRLNDFTSEEICFDHRFELLTGASVYQSYKQTLSRLEKLEFIYLESLQCFSEAKDRFELLGQHEECLKVCKINMVVARILSNRLNSFSHKEIEFSFDTHPSFPTLKV